MQPTELMPSVRAKKRQLVWQVQSRSGEGREMLEKMPNELSEGLQDFQAT